MRYVVLVTTFINRGVNQGEDRCTVQKSKIMANDLAHAQEVKTELHSTPTFFGETRDNRRPAVWMECEVCAEVSIGTRHNSFVYVPVGELQRVAHDVADAASDYSRDKNKTVLKPKLSPSSIRATIVEKDND